MARSCRRPSVLDRRHRPVVLAAVMALAFAGDARAATGDLHVHSGALPDGQPAVVGPWTGLTANTPGGTGTYGLGAGPIGEGYAATSALAPPADLAFAKATAYRSFNAPPSSNHSQPQVSTTWENAGWPYTGGSGGGGFVGDAATGAVSVNTPSSLSTRIACVAFDGVPGSCTGGVNYFIQRLDLTLNDAEGRRSTARCPASCSTDVEDVSDGRGPVHGRRRRLGRLPRVDARGLGHALRERRSVEPALPRRLHGQRGRLRLRALGPVARPVPHREDGLRAGVQPAGDRRRRAHGRVVRHRGRGRQRAKGAHQPDGADQRARWRAPGPGTVGPGGCIWAADGTTCTASVAAEEAAEVPAQQAA